MSGKVIIKNFQTGKSKKLDPFGVAAKKLYLYRIQNNFPYVDPSLFLPAGLTYRAGKIKPIESDIKRLTYDQIGEVGIAQVTYLKKLFQEYKGQTIKTVRKVEGLPLLTKVYKVPTDGFSKWWEEFYGFFLLIDSDTWMFDEDLNNSSDVDKQSQILIMKYPKVKKTNYKQYFLDGDVHCFLNPIKEWADSCESNAKSKPTADKYTLILSKISQYECEYSGGVPVDSIQDICDDLSIAIEIDVPSSSLKKDTKYLSYECSQRVRKTFKFINTRLNHIELNELSTKDNFEDCTKAQLIKLREDNKDIFCLWKGHGDDIYQVNTLQKIYKLGREEGYSKALYDFEKLNNLRDFKIEHFSNLKLSEFLLSNVNINQSLYFDDALKEKIDSCEGLVSEIDIITNDPSIQHIDLRKAYTKGSDCSFYRGYLGKITDFRKTNRIEGIGIYMIENIKNIPECLQKLKVLYERNSYSSPELEYYRSLGITFDILMGCWGSKVDIEFTDGMLEKEDGLSNYCKWYGCTMKLSKVDQYNFCCKDIEFAQLNNIKGQYDIRFNDHDSTGIIEYKKKKAYHSAHISNFICSYCRITMMEQLMKFKDVSQIVAVQVDGLYYRGDVELISGFSTKANRSLRFIQTQNYISPTTKIISVDLPENRTHNMVEVHTGAGGCGKTYNNLIDKGFVNPYFIGGPSWKLTRSKQKEFNIDGSVFHYLLSTDPDKYDFINRNYNNLIIDECSMMTNNDKELILKRFSNIKIIFCGDLGYQLPPISKGVSKKAKEFIIGSIPEIKHTTNYRCQCDILREFTYDQIIGG